MTAAPRDPHLRCGSAGSEYNGPEHPACRTFPAESQAFARLRRQRQVERVYRLGARVVFELIDHLDREHGLGADLDRLLDRFAGLSPEILAAVGGDRFAPSPMRVVGGGGR